MASNTGLLVLAIIVGVPLVLFVQSQPLKNELEHQVMRRDVVSEPVTEESLATSTNSSKICDGSEQQKRHISKNDGEEFLNPDQEKSQELNRENDQERDNNETGSVMKGPLWATQWLHSIQNTDADLHDGNVKATKHEDEDTDRSKINEGIDPDQPDLPSSEETVEGNSSPPKREANVFDNSAGPLQVVGRPEGPAGDEESLPSSALQRSKRQQIGILHLGRPPPYASKGLEHHHSKLFDTDRDKTTRKPRQK